MRLRGFDVDRRLPWLAAACLLAWPLPAAAQARAPQAVVSQYSQAEVQTAVTRLRGAVENRFATETDLESARVELQGLLARADELAAREAQRKDESGPAATAQLEIRRLLAAIDGKLGAAASAETGARAVRGEDFPVPAFEGRQELHELAGALWQAQSDLRDELRAPRADAARTDALIVDLAVAEERLAWEAGWPFLPDEVEALKGVLLEFAKLKEGSARAGELVKGLEARLGTSLEQVARQPEPRPDVFAELRKVYDEIARQGDVGTVNDIDGRIGDVYARRRARGVSAINAQLAEEAASVGRDTPRPFTIHRPATRAGQRAVDNRIAELVAAEIGLPLQLGGPAVVRLSIGTRPFDDALKAALAGRK